MQALTVEPLQSGSLRVEDVAGPTVAPDELLVRGLAVGVCGTDREIVAGDYGWAPDGSQRLILGHESLGVVEQAGEDSSFSVGDHVVGVVRRPDPAPCGACARGEWDMCRNGRYTERGIKQLPGYASEHWSIPAEYAVRVPEALGLVGVLTEPTSVVTKAWEQVERVGNRAFFAPRSVLVTGAGSIGLLAALVGVQRGLDVHVLDRVADGPKPDLVTDLGATYHRGTVAETARIARPDIVIEATGSDRVVLDSIAETSSYGIVCLTGVSPAGRTLPVDVGGLNRSLVLENDVVIGSVNANLRHYRSAVQALSDADRGWARRLVTRVVPLDHAASVFDQPHGPHRRDSQDVKVALAIDERARSW